MSYCRFGEADAYIFNHVDGYLICQACFLPPDRHSFTTHSRSTMLAHVQMHRTRGHRIPQRVDERLKREIAEEGDEVGDGLHPEDPPADEGAGGENPTGPDEGPAP